MSNSKLLAIAAVLAFTGAAQAQTACPGGTTQLTQTQLLNLLPGRMVCVGSGGQWENQEHHDGTGANGALWDFKLGTDPRDPSKQIGTYAILNGQVTYSYTGGASYTYAVCAAPNSYTFVGQSTIAGIIIGGGPARQSCTGLPNVSQAVAAPSRRSAR